MRDTDIIIIGAGATGLMAARKLGEAGKKVLILEARDRIGGRIYPLAEKDFGYPAEGGAEFIHGEAPVTRELMREAGLSYVPTDGTLWNIRLGKPVKSKHGPTDDPRFLAHKEVVTAKLNALTEDMPIAEFLEKYLSIDEFAALREWIVMMVEGYDAADPKKISTFAIRDEWLGGGEWIQGKIREGYGALVNFLFRECQKLGVEIVLNEEVTSLDAVGEGVSLRCASGNLYEGEKVIVTVPLPIISSLEFKPTLLEKLTAVAQIGYGNVIKFILKFKDQWWLTHFEEDLSSMTFLLANPPVTAWWTQYPDVQPVLVGWIPGRYATERKDSSDQEIIELGVESLAKIFKVEKEFVKENLVFSKVLNWPADRFAEGAYSYAMPESREASIELAMPIQDKIFFAGEALYSGDDTATVEGALASGQETAERILKMI